MTIERGLRRREIKSKATGIWVKLLEIYTDSDMRDNENVLLCFCACVCGALCSLCLCIHKIISVL